MTILRPSLLRRIGNSIRLSRRKRGATIDLTPNGFVFSQQRKTVEIRWDQVSQIDAGVRDHITFDTFYIVLFAGGRKLVVEELDDGFRQLEFAIHERWPQIRERWLQLLSVPLHQAHYETLWKRGG
ncbi:MAG: hypothetical protein ABSC92_07865 [Rhizomicrobium sp.]